MASIPHDPFAKPLLFGGLALLATAVFVLVSNLFSTIDKNSTVGIENDAARIEQAAQNNLTPVGSVVAVDKSIAPVARTGAEIYNAVCIACHASGVLDAPKLEKAAWTERAAKGLQGLLESALNGLNQMPARGGDPSLTDAEMQDAILYMMDQAGVAMTADDTAQSDQSDQSDQAAETAPATMASQTAETTTPAAKPVAASAPVKQEAAHNGIDGQKVYQSICFTCHDSGIADSPKPGDKAVWAPRIAAGIDILYESVLQGKGMMPARGGNPALSDDEIKAAVDWLITAPQQF